MNWIISFIDAVGHILLLVMFLVMIFIGIYLILAAYGNLQNTNITIRQANIELTSYIKDSNIVGQNRLTDKDKIYLERIRKKITSNNKGMLDSNTISFLFQIFAIAIISAGIYLLRSSAYAMKKVNTKIKNFKYLINSQIFVSETEGFMAHAYQRIYDLAYSFDENTISETRDSLKQLKDNLDKSRQYNIGMSEAHLTSLLTRIIEVKRILDGLPPRRRNRALNIIDLCKECIQLIENSSFVENLNKQWEKFNEDSKEIYSVSQWEQIKSVFLRSMPEGRF